MAKASDLKKGQVIEQDNQLYLITHIDVKSPSSRGAQTLYKMRFAKVPQGGKHEMTLTGGDTLQEVDLQRRTVSYLYRDGDMFTFMDSEDYSQYLIGDDALEQQLPYLLDGMEGLTALVIDGQALAIELPASVIMEVIETAPAIKGASASARTKPARMATGLEIQVPEYLATGELIKINTETGKFMSRA